MPIRSWPSSWPSGTDRQEGGSSLIDQESELDRLYAAPLEEFVNIRNDLAGRLRKEGDEAAASRIAALKKPTVSAWAVNQLARSGQIDLQRLIKAGEALEQAQRSAMSVTASGFETARREESAAVARLRSAAVQVLPSASAAVLDRIATTLRAGAATAEGRDLIKTGRLTADLEPLGFEAFAGTAATTLAAQDVRSAGSTQRTKIERLRRRKKEAEANLKVRTSEAKALEQEARAAEEAAQRAMRAATTARKRAEAAMAQLHGIEHELAEVER
ncbi:MAG: hypothetical protein ACRDWH_05030 [Acidimicrobiia bacterium]